MLILWDWNGTLVDDAVFALELENRLFAEHGYQTLTLEEYRSRFRLPIRQYYRDLGVSDEDFAPIADQWSADYKARFTECPLAADAADTVRRFREMGFRQVILSASADDILQAQVASYPELRGMFDAVLGVTNIYATGKVQLALDFLQRDGVDPKEAVFLGDTLNDAETAAAIGCRCLLIAAGHQSEDTLKQAGVPVCRSLREAADLILKERA